MKFVLFYHTLISDWNHGNAHFLRGVATELLARGHQVEIYEPEDAWSVQNLVSEYGTEPIRRFAAAYPALRSVRYNRQALDLESVLEAADIVIVHEWNDHSLVAKIGHCRRRSPHFRLYFHDTHHRMVTDPRSMGAYDLKDYDGVLAYGRVLQELYSESGQVRRAWTWHEAADVRVFHPLPANQPRIDLIWIGNWGDDERTAELQEFLIEPIKTLQLKARVYGVRYPEEAKAWLTEAGIDYGGWLANFDVPQAFANAKVTVHVPRRPYTQALPGIPTIRPFEALACGIPMICSPWADTEDLFAPGRDFLVANNGSQMRRQLSDLLNDEALRQELSSHGLKTIRSRHTCAHRVEQLLEIDANLRGERRGTLQPRATDNEVLDAVPTDARQNIPGVLK